jgi:monothiol glutaredoxin
MFSTVCIKSLRALPRITRGKATLAAKQEIVARSPKAFEAERSKVAAMYVVSEMYESFVAKSLKAFEAEKSTVAAALDKELDENQVVLFMEGTPDCPKSKQSMNVIKIFTQIQVVPFLSIDVMTHPALLGYTVSKSSSHRTPHLYINEAYFGDHDMILSKYISGDLENLMKDLGNAPRSTGAYASELPIASY